MNSTTPRLDILDRIALVLALTPALLKAIVPITAFPGWELDPFTFPAPSNGLGPAGAMTCDLVSVLGVLLLFVIRWKRATRVPLVQIILFCLGAVGVLVHLRSDHSGIAADYLGSSWISALLLALAVATLPDDERSKRTRAIVASVLLGLVALLAVRGVQQYFVEHATTVADFRRNREAIFAAQGWSPDSPMAKAYERRLMQPEATGWFGLANVYATFAAAGVVLSLSLLAHTLRSRREDQPPAIAGPVLATLASGAALYFAGGKGGYAAAFLGVIAALAFAALRKRASTHPAHARVVAPALALLVPVIVMALIAFRGVLADRLPELSLLFRWFYTQAALRIGLEHLPLGVGPDGFQHAYMLAKNPLSPEDVTSSHNILLDWFATLGIAGLAWIALWLFWLSRAGAATVTATPPSSTEIARADRWTILALAAIPTAFAIRLDQFVLTPDLALVRILGATALAAVALLTLPLLLRDTPATRIALTAAALAAAAHALIDVTGVWPGSAAPLAILIACAARPGSARPARAPRLTALVAALSTTVLLAFLVISTISTAYVDGRLRRAADIAMEAGAVNERWSAIAQGLQQRRPDAIQEAQALAADLGLRSADPASLDRAVRAFDLDATTRSIAPLVKPAERPAEWKIRREASRIELRRAALLRSLDRHDEADAAEADALRTLGWPTPTQATTPSELAWLSLVLESTARGTDQNSRLLAAARTLEQASKLAPYELAYATRLMHLYEQAGDTARAAAWARRALDLDAALIYDREVKAMSAEDRAFASRLAEGS